jgi:hypothetical protein
MKNGFLFIVLIFSFSASASLPYKNFNEEDLVMESLRIVNDPDLNWDQEFKKMDKDPFLAIDKNGCFILRTPKTLHEKAIFYACQINFYQAQKPDMTIEEIKNTLGFPFTND